jgi:hypothetical protein
MAIIVRNIPRRGAAVLAAHVTGLVRQKKMPSGMTVELRPEELAHSEPHPVFVATLDDLVAGKLLAAAKQTSWRYLLVQGDAPVAEAELAAARPGKQRAKGKDLEFLGLTHGPFTKATVDALSAAEELPQVARADYELRLLKVPALYLVALWLHGADEDILVPIGDPPGGLEKNKPYSEAEIVRALRDTALRTKEFHQSFERTQRERRRKKR